MDLTTWNQQEASARFRGEWQMAESPEDWTNLRNAYLGKKNGLVNKLLTALRDAPRELKPKLGKEINLFKKEVEGVFKDNDMRGGGSKKGSKQVDLTLPGVRPTCGSIHPITLTMREMVGFFVRQGYDVAYGPEIENNFYNFEALNTPEDHPAREEADTFYVDEDRMLRTQTSGCQIRYMQTHEPPFRMVAPGKVYRRDDDITHSPMFHQLEGLVVGENITFAHLKGTLEAFARHIFGPQTRIRLRPSYFPFTEPSAEVDVTCPFCTDGCRVCKNTKWIEALGCGMVDPNVFEAVGYDSEKFTGFAFGMGIDRVAMLKHHVPNIRYLYQNDRRFLDAFRVG